MLAAVASSFPLTSARSSQLIREDKAQLSLSHHLERQSYHFRMSFTSIYFAVTVPSKRRNRSSVGIHNRHRSAPSLCSSFQGSCNVGKRWYPHHLKQSLIWLRVVDSYVSNLTPAFSLSSLEPCSSTLLLITQAHYPNLDGCRSLCWFALILEEHSWNLKPKAARPAKYTERFFKFIIILL